MIHIVFILRRGCYSLSKVSIIIPVYNTENYVEQCILSIQKQTYKHLEIIIVNDGSNHHCSGLLEKLAKDDERIVLISLEKNYGAGLARNEGIKCARGKFLYFMDSDDYIPERTIEMLVSEIKAFPMIRGRLRRTRLASTEAIVIDGLHQVSIFIDRKYSIAKHSTAVNLLIRKDYVQEYNLCFDEKSRAYSDLQFLISALVRVEQIPYFKEALYFKRLRNDPINQPSLMQENAEKRILDYLTTYTRLKSNLQYTEAFEFLDKHLLNFYRADIVMHMKKSAYIDSIFESLSSSLELIDSQLLKQTSFIARREIRAIVNGNIKKFKRINHTHQFLRKLKWGLSSKRKLVYFLHNRIFSLLPTKKKQIFLESFLGESYSDSPKAIYEYMQKHYPAYSFVWSFDDKKQIPGNAKQVKRFSLRYFYHLAQSAYWISNARMPNQLVKSEDTTFLQTWHGTPLKRLALDMDEVSMPGTNAERYKNNFVNETKQWDYLIAPNAYSSEIFKRAFYFKGEMLEVGYPRNDLLVNADGTMIESVKKKLGIPLDKKVIIYAPTWRDDEYFSRGNYKFTLRLDLDKMQRQFGDEYIVLLRTHYLISNALDISGYEGFVYDFSSYDDIAELYVVSDILITDYSSVFFDFANLKRPILFYTYDIEKYRDQLRGFYIDMEEELPGPLLYTSDEVIDAIENIDEVQEEYKEKYEMFSERFCAWDDGHAAQKTVERVFGKKK